MLKEKVETERRQDERIPISLPVKIYCKNSFYSGVAMNVSKKGMFIKTGISLPSEIFFDVCIPYKGGDLRIAVRLVRLSATFGYFDAIGVEVLNPPSEYANFIASLR